jgi:hypothetical protein
MNSNPNTPRLTEVDSNADLDRALGAASDSILPSSGFADGVMSAVYREASAPAPLAFPWKRAIPGVAAAVMAALLLIAAVVSFLHSSWSRSPSAIPFNLQTIAADLAHPTNGATWVILSLAISGACLLFCRRLVSSR